MLQKYAKFENCTLKGFETIVLNCTRVMGVFILRVLDELNVSLVAMKLLPNFDLPTSFEDKRRTYIKQVDRLRRLPGKKKKRVD